MSVRTASTTGHSATAPNQATDEQLIAAARELAPMLAAHADEASRLGRPVDAVIEALEEAGLFAITAPRIRGGHQASLKTFIRVEEELAKGCGSTSWVTGLYNGGIFMMCTFSDRALDEVYAEGTPRVFAAFNPAGQAVPTGGGYLLSGTWRFCSGQHHANWGLLASLIMREGQEPEPAVFIVKPQDLTRADDWHVSGLEASGSNTMSVENLFVPDHMAQSSMVAAMGQSESESLRDDTYFQMPNIPFFSAGAVGTPLGLASAALDIVQSRIHKRGITYTAYGKQSDAVITHLQMDEAMMRLAEARFHAERAADSVLYVAENLADVATRVQIRSDAAWCFKRCHEVVEIVRQASGASAIHRSSPLGRIVNDIQALTVHSFIVHSTNSELHGRVRCGLAPDVPFF